MLPVEDCEAPLVVEDAVLCSAVLEKPDSEEGLEDEREEEPEGDSEERLEDEGEGPEDDSDEEAVLVTLPEPLAEVETLPVDDAPDSEAISKDKLCLAG